MYTPTLSDGRGIIAENPESEDLTDSDSVDKTGAVLFGSQATTTREISPCSITTPSTINQPYMPGVSDKILSNCCCMFEEIQSELRRVPGNATCCDCGAPEPQWASVTLASLVCIRCAGLHRALGVKKSRIRSLQMDSWGRSQVLRMLMGGNSRLRDAFVVAGETFDEMDVPARYSGAVALDYLAELNARCPPATPSTPFPRPFEEDQEVSPSLQLRRRLPPLSKRVPSMDSLDEAISKSDHTELHTVTPTHRAYCPCSSSQRWTHLPTIAGEQRNMPILCSGGITSAVEDKNCIVSWFSKLKTAVMQICGGT